MYIEILISCMHAHMHACKHAHTHTQIYTHTYMQVHMQICIHIYQAFLLLQWTAWNVISINSNVYQETSISKSGE